MASCWLGELERSQGGDLEAWENAKKHDVFPNAGDRHIIHSYFNASPESPDGRYVLYFSSTDPKGESGDICVLERTTGHEVVLATGVTTEDAHRVACQQWADNGKSVVYHDFRSGQWIVVAIELSSLRRTVLVENRQLGYGSPTQPWVPVYGCHWNPGLHRDLELVNVRSGELRTLVTAERVVAAYKEWLGKTFGSLDVSLFFPVMSPDGTRVFFKVSRPGGGDSFRSKDASLREGKIVYDLNTESFIKLFPQWGHPSWHPDSRQIFEKGNVLLDPTTGTFRRPAPSAVSDHPSVSPDGRLFVTDADVSRLPFGLGGERVVAVGSMDKDEWSIVDQFDNTHGPKSWRRNHPHPCFNADGDRLYYNVNDGPWTRLKVAEANNGS